MAGLTAERGVRRLYRTMPAVCLTCRRCRRLPAIAAVLLLALAGGGCSFQLGSMFDRGSDRTKTDITGSIKHTATPPSATAPQSDLALRAAARELLGRNEATTSLPWENPSTGARGTVTPLAKAYREAGLTCRDFLASYVRDGSESWLQGEACDGDQGWEVRSLRPWTSS